MSELKRWIVKLGFVEREKNEGRFRPDEREKIVLALMSGEEKPNNVNFLISPLNKPYQYRVFETTYYVEAKTQAEASVLGHTRKNLALGLLADFNVDVSFCNIWDV